MSNPAMTYESMAVPVLFGPWATELVAAMSPADGERVLDLACGTAVVARRVAARVRSAGKLAGLDRNPAMLAVAGEVAEREGIAVELHEGRMESLPFGDGAFDLVLCQQGLQFAEDRPRAVSEMRRVLDRGGRVGIAAWREIDLHPFYRTFNEILDDHLGIPALAAPFSLADAGELAGLLEAAGFQDVRVEPRSMSMREPDPARFVASSVESIVAAIPDAQHLDDGARAALTEAVAADLEPHVRANIVDGCVVLDWHAHFARARAA
jgi:ubiquinone/menaquinone biosynthesis C-methylase UbiE